MRVVHLPKLPSGPNDPPPDPPFFVDPDDDCIYFDPLTWPAVLAMAISDGAALVQFRTWPADGGLGGRLTYTAGWTLCEFYLPPTVEYHSFLAEARELLTPNRLARWWGRLTGAATVGQLRFVAGRGDESDWCGVVWSAGGITGVDFHRLGPAPVVPPVEAPADLGAAHLRVARPTDDLAAVVRFYRDGLGLDILSEFRDHDGFDGVMLGRAGTAYHLEFTRKAGHPAGRAPTADNLLVFYLPDPDAWAVAVARMERHGYRPVPSFNPYWDRAGKTFEDPDGYRVVLQNAAWGG